MSGRGQAEVEAMVEKDRMREALGRFATGVTVITVNVDDRPHGMTANAFMSGSLDPPLILISVARHARTHAAIEAGKQFGVSILTEAQHEVAACFAGRDVPFEGRFEYHDGIPVVADSLAWLVARVESRHPVADHTLFVGEVGRLGLGEEAMPLAYFAGAFRELTEPPPQPGLDGWFADRWG
jgi:flavin reductase (DIM6/NTAB) family NADH-FMN oxidoreductase RutF